MINKENLNKRNLIESNRFIYQEVTEIRREQNESILLLNNKINWLLGATVLIIGFLLTAGLNNHQLYLIAFIFLLISIVSCLASLWIKKYKQGPNLIDIHDKRDKLDAQDLIASINKRIIKDIGDNKAEMNNFKTSVAISTISLFVALLLITIAFFGL